MKRFLFIVASVLMLGTISLSVSAQKQTREVSNFTRVGFAVPGELYVKTGTSFSLELEGSERMLSKVVTEVKDGRLVIKMENPALSWNEKVTARITMPSVEGLSISGSGKIFVESSLNGNDLSLSISGSGKIFSGDLDYSKLTCSISGSGDFDFSGKGNVGEASLSISGSGNFKAPLLDIKVLEARISGSGSCDCHVTGSLTASIAGSGNIYYSGTPRIDLRASGSGKVMSK